MAVILHTDYRVVRAEPKNGRDFSLEELRKIVGGHIEIIHVNFEGEESLMVCNEEGKVMGLEPNSEASFVARQYIVGDVLICRPDEML